MPLARRSDVLRRMGGSVALLAAATGLSYLLPHRLLAVPATLYFLATLGVTRLLGGWGGLGAAVVSVVLLLYLFAFRGADLQMYALSHRGAVWLMGAVLVALTAAIRYHDHGRGQPVIDVPDDGLALLQLSGSDV